MAGEGEGEGKQGGGWGGNVGSRDKTETVADNKLFCLETNVNETASAWGCFDNNVNEPILFFTACTSAIYSRFVPTKM